MPRIDILNGLITAVFQVSLALIPFYFFLRQYSLLALWIGIACLLAVVLYFTWYKNLPSRDEV
jgi:hypothetical protein